MMRVQAPNLLLSFFSAKDGAKETMIKIVAHILERKATPLQWVRIPFDGTESEVRTFDTPSEGVEWIKQSPSGFEFEVDFQPWLMDHGTIEQLSNMSSLPMADPSSVVRLVASGEQFEGMSASDKTVSIGQGVRSKFAELCTKLRPDYAAITIEHELETPEELALDPRSYAFSDCFLCTSLITSKEAEEITKELTFVEIEHLEGGTLFISNPHFRPAMVGKNQEQRVTEERYKLTGKLSHVVVDRVATDRKWPR